MREMQTDTKNTGELLSVLENTENWEEYRKENAGSFRNTTVAEELLRLCREKSLSKAELAKNSGISDIYLYQILRGIRTPSRVRMICMCMGLKLSEEESQRFLRACGFAPLYVRQERDAIILHAMMHGTDLQTLNEELYEQEKEPLLK